ncbi:MAG: hypothetical protein RL684_849 [Pseudomonadota bacterium]
MSRLDGEQRYALRKTRSAIKAARRAIERVVAAGGWWADVDELMRGDLESAAHRFGVDLDGIETTISELYPTPKQRKRQQLARGPGGL